MSRELRAASLIFQNKKGNHFQEEILKLPRMENIISERENRLIARATQGVVVALGDRLNS